MPFTAHKLLLFGATGDLAQRMLLPSLCALTADGLTPPDLQMIGTARSAQLPSAARNCRMTLSAMKAVCRTRPFADTSTSALSGWA